MARRYPFGRCVICRKRPRRSFRGLACDQNCCRQKLYVLRKQGKLPALGHPTCSVCGGENPRPRATTCSHRCGVADYKRRYEGFTRADWLELYSEGLATAIAP